MKIYLIVVAGLLISACSNKAVYDNIQLNNRQSCAKLPPSQYKDCVEQTEKNYEEYQRDVRVIQG